MPPHLLAAFFGGLFLTNAFPHLAAGTTGRPFPTPFTSPPGRGLSSPVVNVAWGLANLLAGCLLSWGVADVRLQAPLQAAAFGAAVLVLALFHAVHFGAVHAAQGRSAR